MFFLSKNSESVTLSPICEGSVKSGALSPTLIDKKSPNNVALEGYYSFRISVAAVNVIRNDNK